MTNVKFGDNMRAVLARHERNVAKALVAIGVTADRITRAKMVESGRIDTGAMLDSVGSRVDVRNSAVVHGIGVHYGIFQEIGTRHIGPGDFIRDNINGYQKEYQAIAKAVFGCCLG